MVKKEVSGKLCVINYRFLCKRLKTVIGNFWGMNYLCKRLKIAKFFILKRSKKCFLGCGDYRPSDTNPSDATG